MRITRDITGKKELNCLAEKKNVLHFRASSLKLNICFLRLGYLNSPRETVLYLLKCRGTQRSMGPLELYYSTTGPTEEGWVRPLCLKQHLSLPPLAEQHLTLCLI